MEFEQDSNLTLPLFLLDETLSERDLEQPDFEISIGLDDELLAQICQNPSEDSSIAITVNSYELLIADSPYLKILDQEHDAQITLTHGPLLSVILNTEDQKAFVSPQMDMMPTFDLGDEDE
ncbi:MULTISPECIES: hypothetical protein [Pseudoalteromonas]|jgi:hypothetical protein|uniref:Orphan protein n=2 Tax=Pseudoalteromonas aliena TaxID=247523 RepID=A0A1Q2GWL2_9GAMM|nr:MULTISPECIES: hypothetical protein [Pseudoalteromonas]AQP99521.1 hypothetical protein B0W48_06710 [Pseudoalteromonas aliena]MBB1387707.1 hypothetical protein [Pseudoalteromonas sp. SG45-5]MBB1395930.1 hypothetical protein [Pseudoalteromonas sp. SG44-4]MBB1449239.1 hypothetical protein [Pseudoalteromonas sp. SG41-6]MBE0360458.1 hypothetical protein [Pseudoalteromonas aliena SW19]